MYYLNKEIRLKLSFKQHIFKPIFVSAIMGTIVYFAYRILIGYAGNAISTIVSILIGVILYAILVLVTKMLTKEDIYMIPFGTKIYGILVKLGIYKEEN